jgi:glutamate-1-semialdehyde 2,1-aminomutase
MGKKSQELFARAQTLMPGGVNSPVRAFRSVGGEPPFIAKGLGSRIFDVDNKGYLDYVGSWGPLIVGHANPYVVEAIRKAAERGTSYGAPSPSEVELAELVVEAVPSIEMIRMVNSGTEATMAAVRVARAFTGRDRIVKFDGCYHGHADGFLVKGGSGIMTLGLPDSPGVPREVVKLTMSIPFNDPAALGQLFAEHPGEIAAVIVEPVVGNSGTIPPAPGFLEELRRLTEKDGAILIFDEVMTGFRVAYGGAQELYGIRPDMTTLGKIIGGGLPVGAYGGRREIMKLVAPSGPVYQAGTLSGNPIAMAAGAATLKILKNDSTYRELEERSHQLAEGISKAAAAAGVALVVNRVGSMLTPFLTDQPVTDATSAGRADRTAFATLHQGLIEEGIYWPASQFEAGFVSTTHSGRDIDETSASFGRAFARLGAR